MNLTWMPFYHELVEEILKFEDRQDELLAIDSEMRNEGLLGPSATTLNAIDPFTFLLRLGTKWQDDAARKESCKFLKSRWNINAEVPADFHGCAKADVGALRFAHDNNEKQTRDLWKLAKQAFQGIGSVDIDLFESCACNAAPKNSQRKEGFDRLIAGLNWINPKEFLSIDSTSDSDQDDSEIETPYIATYGEYLDFLTQNIDRTKINTMKVTLNQILYGPPGTGKTYNSIQKAVEIIDGQVESEPQVKARFKELRDAGQIGFVTFHQSFSYEEFIEGLRPILNDGEARYEIRDGILKGITLKALNAGLEKATPSRATFGQIWDKFLEKVADENWVLEGIKTHRFKVTKIQSGDLDGDSVNGKSQKPYRARRKSIEQVWNKLRDGEVANNKLVKEILGVESHEHFIASVVEELKRIDRSFKPTNSDKSTAENVASSFLTNSPDYYANFQNSKKFVLIIDEINRGNISKILGELITLLEEDKRIGAENELRLTLPTSGETFALPPNLYILGTMNTSDKSLAQLDVALRRRFSFIEMPPRYDLDELKKLEGLVAILRELNDRLEWALDREHRLGHAYFMKVDSEAAFNEKFESQIVPLLIEYFPHDFQTLRAVLGEKENGFLVEMTKPDGFAGNGKKYRWWFESGVAGFSAFATLKANYKF